MDIPLSDAKRAFLDEQVHPHIPDELAPATPRCEYFETCGGCHLQHLPYSTQLVFKKDQVRTTFERYGLRVDGLLEDTAGMDDPWAYRNKADFNARAFMGRLRLGFTRFQARGIVEVDRCPIASGPINEALSAYRRLLPRWPALKRKLHSLIVRSSASQNMAAVLYHTRLKDPQLFSELTRSAQEHAPRIAGGGYIHRKREHALGRTRLTERILGIDFTYSLPSFFQANPFQTEVLCSLVREMAAVSQEDSVLDLYSGVGLFSLVLARQARTVHAVEETHRSVEDAVENARANDILNCTFIRGRTDERLETLLAARTRADVIVLDPPRSGCSPETLELLLRFRARRLIYVSCNPDTLARDVAYLAAKGLRLSRLKPVDMFPQTMHIECAALLEPSVDP